MDVPTEYTIDAYLKSYGFKSLVKVKSGEWNMQQRYKDTTVQINIGFFPNDNPELSVIQVGCLFLKKPRRNQGKLFERMVQLQREQAFCFLAKYAALNDGDIVIAARRCIIDLDPHELRDMISDVATLYKETQEECFNLSQ